MARYNIDNYKQTELYEKTKKLGYTDEEILADLKAAGVFDDIPSTVSRADNETTSEELGVSKTSAPEPTVGTENNYSLASVNEGMKGAEEDNDSDSGLTSFGKITAGAVGGTAAVKAAPYAWKGVKAGVKGGAKLAGKVVKVGGPAAAVGAGLVGAAEAYDDVENGRVKDYGNYSDNFRANLANYFNKVSFGGYSALGRLLGNDFIGNEEYLLKGQEAIDAKKANEVAANAAKLIKDRYGSVKTFNHLNDEDHKRITKNIVNIATKEKLSIDKFWDKYKYDAKTGGFILRK